MITSACSHKDLYRDLSAGRYTFFEVLYIYFAGTVFSIANFFGLGDSIFDYAIQHQDWGVLLACLHWSHDNGRTYLNKKARFLLTPDKALDNFEFVKYVFDNFNWKSEHFLHVDCNGNTLLHNAVQQLCRRPYSDATDAAALRLIDEAAAAGYGTRESAALLGVNL